MAKEYIDRIRASQERPTTPEEISFKLLNDFRIITDKARSKSIELIDEYGSRNEVKREIKKLLQRAELLSSGISGAAPEASLAFFSDYLSEQTKAMEDSFDFILDNEMLARVLERYGEGIQGNMVTNRLLSAEAAARLTAQSNNTQIDEKGEENA